MRDTVANWTQASLAARTVRRVRSVARTSARSSWTTSAIATVAAWIRHAWLYRWLTKEPDPDVIVIDLRETWTVGPIVALLNRIVIGLASARSSSTIADSIQSACETVRNAPVRIASLFALAAVGTHTLFQAATGTLSRNGVVLRTFLLFVLALGTRIDAPWDELGESRVGRWITAILAPPEPPAARSPGPGEEEAPDDGREDAADSK